jgi:hypothetical protein
MVPRQAILASLRSFWIRGRRIERIGYLVGVLLLTSGIVHLGILSVSGGSWDGPLSFRKPAVFGLSFGLTLITIVWTASFLPLAERTRLALLSIFTAACVLETALVSLQAWRRVPSHFNVETAFDGYVARALAAGGFALVAVIVGLTVTAFRKNPTVPVSLRVALRIGFVVLCAAMAVGATMIARGMMLVFAGNAAAAYATGGSLKPTHAVTMHAILVLPAIAWLVSFADWTEDRRLRLVLLASGAYLVLAGAVAVANIAGMELGQLPTAVEGLMGLAALLILVSAVLALAGAVRLPNSRGLEHG